MTYLNVAYIHLVTVAPCFVIGVWLLARRKGFLPAEVGPRILDHFGFIHLFSLLVLTCIPLAGSFALMPGRLPHGWLFG